MITVTNDKDVIKQIMCDPLLFKASMPDEDLAALKAGTWEPHDQCIYLNYDNKAIIRLYSLTNLSVDMHIHLKPEFWGTGTSESLAAAVEKYLVENTNFCKIVIQTPACCRAVLKAATRDGYSLEGILTASILWRDKVENLILMSKFIKRSNLHG